VVLDAQRLKEKSRSLAALGMTYTLINSCAAGFKDQGRVVREPRRVGESSQRARTRMPPKMRWTRIGFVRTAE